ncbi:MAG: hypothetical protein HQL15_06910 [Candidatus Omnitrophica bacterium]|nr:hypothetical protein [Candidatus Omnitrophota bacterium]
MKNSTLNALLWPSSKLCSALVLAAFLLSGCGHPEKKPQFSVTEAQKIFEDKCIKDFGIHVRTRQIGQTFWIYLPLKTPIFDYEVQKEKPPTPDAKENPKYVVNFADGKFNNGIFSFEYDITEKKKSKEEDYGFNSSYTDSYVKNQNNIFTAIYEVFLNAKAKGSEINPKFFVVVITDIKKGIETRSTFYLKDFMRFMSGDIPNDEYMKRFLGDRKGSPSFIGDETGSHIKYTDMTMSGFLTKQIVNRIHFKFQYSDFTPKEPDLDKTIIGIVADTTKYYKFDDFTNVRLNNLRLNKKYLFDKAQLVNFGEEKPKENDGKLIHISFKDGKPEFNEEELSDQKSSNADEKTSQ